MPEITSNDKIQVLSVFLDEQMFGIEISKIEDVLMPLHLTEVPLAEAHIQGVSNLRGRIVTAINLRKRLKMDSVNPSESMNVVVENHNELYSVLVDRVGDVLTLDARDIEKPPLTLNPLWHDLIDGVCQMEDTIMVILDTEKSIHTD